LSVNPDEIRLDDLGWTYRAARVLHVANNLDIFTVLARGAMRTDQIAEACRTKPAMTEKLLIACAAMGLLEKSGDAYKNSALAETYLVAGRELYQGDIIRHSASVWNFWHRLENEIRIDGGSEETQPDEHRTFIMAMHNIAAAGRAKELTDRVDLSGKRLLFDVGGGPGTYAIELCRRYPPLRAVVFDLPETIVITREVIARENMQDTVSVREGSWDTDDFGEGNDVVLLSNVLHGPDSKAQMKLIKAYESMIEGAVLIVQDFVLNDAKTGPLIPALFNIMVGAYSRRELFSLIDEAGFVNPKLPGGSIENGNTVMTAVKS